MNKMEVIFGKRSSKSTAKSTTSIMNWSKKALKDQKFTFERPQIHFKRTRQATCFLWCSRSHSSHSLQKLTESKENRSELKWQISKKESRETNGSSICLRIYSTRFAQPSDHKVIWRSRKTSGWRKNLGSSCHTWTQNLNSLSRSFLILCYHLILRVFAVTTPHFH